MCKLKVLVACEESQRVCTYLSNAGASDFKKWGGGRKWAKTNAIIG